MSTEFNRLEKQVKRPTFKPGQNLAIKVPAHEYNHTVSFYRDTLGLEEPLRPTSSSTTESTTFQFGDKVLWVDRVSGLSQAEIWLEVVVDDVDHAKRYLKRRSCAFRDDIEGLPDDFEGFWLSSPANIIHLVSSSDAT